jgi:phosphoenolpyruvate-protein phosphotransferase (PTS system enzyme I)
MTAAPLDPAAEIILQGIPVSSGVAHGVVRHVGGRFEEPDRRKIHPRAVVPEIDRYRHAVNSTRLELEGLVEKLDANDDANAREILEMHLMVLDDSTITEKVQRGIREDLECAEFSYFWVVRRCMDSFQKMPDAYFRERALDIRDVAQRVLRHLRGEPFTEDGDEQPAICIAHDLTPSETAQLDRSKVLGFAIEHGSRTSHTAIVARSLGLPAVVQLHGVCDALHTGDHVLLDGDAGLLIVRPTEETLTRYRALELDIERRAARFQGRAHESAVTLDGTRITVAANAEFVEELDHIRDSGAEGVGLFRTEFLYLENPDAAEEKLTNVYVRVVQALAPKLVIFRTLDLGGDKLDPASLEDPEANPFLGWRGIRVSLARRDFFKRQLRAILRASAYGNVGIMYPMVCSAQEVILANELVAECREELLAEGKAVAEKVQLGAMIEIPSAAVTADLIVPHVDFFSIGTNDLIQYTLAVDRVNERVADLYKPTHPAVLRLIKQVVEASRGAGVWVGMCGEMAGDVQLTPLLIGLGLDELSAASGQVAKVKHAIRALDRVDCTALVAKALQCDDPVQIFELCQAVALRCYPELFEQ